MSFQSVLMPVLTFLYTHRIWYCALLCLCSLLAFLLFGIDKYKAKHGLWRISERTLLLSAFFFGGAGALLGMLVFRHKTKHWYFRLLLTVLMLLQFFPVLYLLFSDFIQVIQSSGILYELPKLH